MVSREALAGGDRSAERFGISRTITPAAFFMFRTNGYVQDERYTAGAWMRRSGASEICTVFDAGMRRSGVMFRMNGISRGSTRMCGAIVSILHSVSLSAWAPRSRGTFLSDSPQAHPCGLGRDIHVAHGPKVRYLTPSAMCVITVHWFLTDGVPPQLQSYAVHIHQNPQH